MGPELSNNCCRPDWRHVALLTLDVQQGFTLPGAPVEIPSTVSAALHNASVGPRLSGGATDPSSTS